MENQGMAKEADKPSMKYIHLLAGNGQREETERTLKNEEAHLNLQSHKLELKKSIANAKGELFRLKSADVYQPREIYKQKNKVDLLERELAYMDELEQEQF